MTTRAGRGEDDAVSYDERQTSDGEDAEGGAGPAFSGDVRVRAREVLPKGSTYQAAPPELQHNVYFYQRTRMALGSVGGGYLIKRPSVGPTLSLDNLREFGTLKASVELKETGPVDRMVAGNYTMVFGQGLLFYDGFGEFVRPIEVKDKGPRPDYTSGANDYLRGAAGRLAVGPVGLDFFTSEKPLDFPLNSDGTVNANLDDLHEGTGDVQTVNGIINNNSVTERLAGGRAAWENGPFQMGVSGYQLHFTRPFNPVDTQYADARAFRGDTLGLLGVDFRLKKQEWQWMGEVARSRASGPGTLRPGGPAWTATALWGAGRSHFWLGLFDYDTDFISPHGKGLSFGVSGGPESLPRNQRGGVLGGEWVKGVWSGRANATLAQFPEALGNGTNTAPLAPSQGRYLLADQRWAVEKDVEFRLMFQERVEDKYLPDPASGVRRQVSQGTQKWRGAVSWEPTRKVRWTLRHDLRLERTPALDKKASGRMWVADAQFTPRPGTRIKVRTYFFNSPEAYLTTGPEEIWDGVVYDRLAGNLGNLRGSPGTRMYLIAGQEWGPLRFWGKYEVTNRPAPSEGRAEVSAPARRAWHIQVDGRWGGKMK
ncbi:MAG: hypothetical protein IPN90_08330 [Elusimicrobia bacterium]|nr:hypothetical protein [Elusimicrobiota bacterium]